MTRSFDQLSRLGAGVLLILLVCGAMGYTGLFGEASAIVGPPLQAPGGAHLFGTDNLGRSILARTIAGIQQSVLLASGAVLIAVLIGTALGMLAGYFRGLIDEVIARLADALFSFPAIVFAILISALFRPGAASAIAAVVLVTLPAVIRTVRAETLVISHRDYVVQARVAGAGPIYALAMHIAPNISGALIVQTAYSVSFGMIIESGISFLGLGVQPPGASLGSLIFEGRPYLPLAPWLVLIPGAVLALTILSINLIGDGLKDYFSGSRS
jgi:peptide/nickel transport system permease protein